MKIGWKFAEKIDRQGKHVRLCKMSERESITFFKYSGG